MLFLEITLSWSRALQSSCYIIPHEMNKQSVLFHLGLSPLAVYFRSSRSLTMVVLCDIMKTAALWERDNCVSCFILGETIVDQKHELTSKMSSTGLEEWLNISASTWPTFDVNKCLQVSLILVQFNTIFVNSAFESVMGNNVGLSQKVRKQSVISHVWRKPQKHTCTHTTALCRNPIFQTLFD